MTRRPLRAAVLSAGAWSRSSHLPALASSPEVELVSVTSPEPGRAAATAAEFGAAHFSERWEDALARDPDLVVVSSPPSAHEAQVVGALEAGAHVLVEKPFALESGAARRMHAAAERLGRSLLVGFGWTAAPLFLEVARIQSAGLLGELEQLNVHLAVNTRALLSGGNDGGWAGASASAPDTYTQSEISGGGTGAVSMSHQLGLVRWLTGVPFSRVFATAFPPRSDIDLHMSSHFELANGAAAALTSASTHPSFTTPQWRMSWYGSRGQLTLDSARNELELVTQTGERLRSDPGSASGVYSPGAPTEALIRCGRGAAVPVGLGSALAVEVVAATDALYASSRRGEMVSVEKSTL